MIKLEQIEWHPIEDGLPDVEFGVFLITVTRWSSVTDSWVEDDVLMSDFYKGDFDICRRFYEHKPIVKAWAERPKPYKEDKSE